MAIPMRIPMSPYTPPEFAGLQKLSVFLQLIHYARYNRSIAKYVPLEPSHIQEYTFVSWGDPMDPLKPFCAPGDTIVSGGPDAPLENM